VGARAGPLATLPLSNGMADTMKVQRKRGRDYYPAGFAIRVSKVYDIKDDDPRKKVARVKA